MKQKYFLISVRWCQLLHHEHERRSDVQAFTARRTRGRHNAAKTPTCAKADKSDRSSARAGRRGQPPATCAPMSSGDGRQTFALPEWCEPPASLPVVTHRSTSYLLLSGG